MLKIFTKKGDVGETALADGTRVAKCSELVELYGCLDELNAFVGWSGEALHSDIYQAHELRSVVQQLCDIQRKLFALAQQLTSPTQKAAVTKQDVEQLEAAIEAISDKLPVLKSFILPGGGEAATRLHIARTVCRRAERAAFRAVAAKHKNAEMVGIYLNRLSDWLFVAARLLAFITSVEEIPV